ncbi:DUF3048 domain-containing protein [Candidatus Falkowbacteria bacterium]|uniref:DUF3048 domain-containing protein n=1 Tax=Candidatus Buchananbacteria bacterium CG10_big_fil_rev_8_21_14_0_10_33_19 TaxID=1974525 RepID=A0A2H0W3I6_9BACT|nr:DUF3048 domain-containing protein [Candidatus Falkowbacteria bacterium]PIS05919.1 MAG: hypothetical protein COT80_04085 [Candidatus Buchananbacteria bacterium CG10_big_fil_rev_8_21_14_0_10_33_19]
MTKLVKIQLAIAVPLVLVGGFFAFFTYRQLTQNIGGDVATVNEDGKEVFYSRLDGTIIDQNEESISAVGVMIENHVEARPQSGLSQAKIVYEVLVESDITRFLAIYDLSENLEKIGPIRSARPYFIDIASEYQATYVHSGGSPEALKRLKTDNLVINLDEFFGYNTGYFWRDNKRYAPHNLYTSSDLLFQAMEHYNVFDYSDFRPWQFKDGTGASDNNSEIKINYSEASSYQVIWKYSVESNQYERWQNNVRHIDADGSIIETDNVIVQFANIKILDEVGRKDIRLTGTNKAIIFHDGQSIIGYYKKINAGSRTIFYDDNDNEIELNRGKIWIEVVPSDLEIEY